MQGVIGLLLADFAPRRRSAARRPGRSGLRISDMGRGIQNLQKGCSGDECSGRARRGRGGDKQGGQQRWWATVRPGAARGERLRRPSAGARVVRQ
jgi:hypothetical protein